MRLVPALNKLKRIPFYEVFSYDRSVIARLICYVILPACLATTATVLVVCVQRETKVIENSLLTYDEGRPRQIKAARARHKEYISSCATRELDVRTCQILWQDSNAGFHWSVDDVPPTPDSH